MDVVKARYEFGCTVSLTVEGCPAVEIPSWGGQKLRPTLVEAGFVADEGGCWPLPPTLEVSGYLVDAFGDASSLTAGPFYIYSRAAPPELLELVVSHGPDSAAAYNARP